MYASRDVCQDYVEMKGGEAWRRYDEGGKIRTQTQASVFASSLLDTVRIFDAVGAPCALCVHIVY